MVGRLNIDDSRILMTFGPLIVRVVLGPLFIINGWPKLVNLEQTQVFST